MREVVVVVVRRNQIKLSESCILNIDQTFGFRSADVSATERLLQKSSMIQCFDTLTSRYTTFDI